MPSVPMSIDSPWALIEAANQAWRESHPQSPLHLYVLAEAGQDRLTWQRLLRYASQHLSLLGEQDNGASAVSPHLLDLGLVMQASAELQGALAIPHPSPAFTLLTSPLSLGELHAHLSQFTEVRLAGGIEMILAFWDPAILGTLVGQESDDSLHVAGPVFDPDQRQTLLAPLAGWWYCDREARWHGIRQTENASALAMVHPITLTQTQEDLLVEASVPDQVLYHLALNRPNLLDETKSHAMHHGFVKAVLGPARALGLTGMRDLVNFTALCLIYRRRMQTDPHILSLLDQVQQKTLTLDQAMPLMPE
ncbi:MAG: hypothetical protein RJA98_1698 [Pseudomonadota bacterium]